ncbi:MAG: PAS domain S-box protein [Holophaga sp.]|jgi:PAS domain S-box-containing protein
MNPVRALMDSGRRWAWWPILGLPVLMAALCVTVEPTVFYDPAWLILLGNTLFVGVVSFLVAAIAWRNFGSTGRIQVLLLGCAMLVFGLGGILAAVVRGLPGGANLNVTIYNTGALVGALLHAAAAVILSGDLAPETRPGRRIGWLCLGYGASVLFMGLLTLASCLGAVPVFFVQGIGPAPLRQEVLSAAILLFVLSGLVFLATYRRNGEAFLYWYAGALALTAISLAGFFVQHSVGSPVGWTGRFSQYLGGVYFLAALLSAERQGQLQGASLDAGLTESLVGAEERFRSAFANAAIGFAMMSTVRRLFNANPAYCELTGYSLEELRSLDAFHLVHPEDRAADMDLNRRMLAGEMAGYTLEHRCVRKDGRLVWVRKTLSLARNPQGKPRWIVALVEDITLRKQAEEIAQENRSKLEAALASMTDAVFIPDTGGRFVEFNEAFATYHKFRNKEECYKTLAEYPDYIDVYFPDGTLAPLDQWAVPRALRGETVVNAEYRLRRKDTGESWWGSYSFGPIRDQEGRIVGSVVVGRDITERKRIEADLREANQQKDEFLATLAHELRNPLAPIRTAAHILKLRPTGDPDLKELHDLIGRQAAHMARLVDDLLDVSRIERGKLTLKKERMDFGAAVARALEASRALIDDRRHRLEVDLPGSPLQLEADPARVDQMVCNLVNNACKYTPPGGRIQVSAYPEGPEAVLCVRDNGVGMSPETLQHAFDLFYQKGQTLDRPEGGLGIGLTLVDRLVRLHHGTVTAASQGLGQGSEFTLRLPAMGTGIALVEPTVRPHEAVLQANAERTRHVLVVDDNESVVSTTQLLLSSLGFRVSSAGTGEEGLRRILERRPDIVLVDLGLPGLNGYQVASKVRERLGRAIHLIALTGYSREADIAAATAAGFDKYLVKSSDPDDLVATLREYLD